MDSPKEDSIEPLPPTPDDDIGAVEVGTPSAETAIGRVPPSIEEQLEDALGIGGVIDIQTNGFRVKVGGFARFGHGATIADALHDLAYPKALD